MGAFIFIGESDRYQNKPLHQYLMSFLRENGVAGATVLRGIEGFGKTSHIHSPSILRLSMDLPIIIEIVDHKEKIEKIKPELCKIIGGGLITEERVQIIHYESEPQKEPA